MSKMSLRQLNTNNAPETTQFNLVGTDGMNTMSQYPYLSLIVSISSGILN